MVVAREQRTEAWIGGFSKELTRLQEQLREANSILCENNQLINYFQQQESVSIKEFDACLDQIKSFDNYVNNYIVKKGVGILKLSSISATIDKEDDD
tara:strand:+ start:4744 stop:5034 length:291 start_codon:yes stop_codon:yes gene_type:complete